MSIPNYCKILETPGAKFDVYFLHGFKGNIRRQFDFAKRIHNLGYTSILCDARGHGKRYKIGSKLDWAESLNDINNIINNRKKPAILIGHSMGATHAITIGIKNENVKQVFAIGAAHGQETFDTTPEKLEEFAIKQKIDLISEKDEKKMRDTLPFLYERCAKDNSNKFFLIHAKNDKMVSFDEFQKNKAQLCLSNDNVLVYDHILNIGNLPHIMPFYKKETIKFIENKIKRN